MDRSYYELSKIKGYKNRLEYLKLLDNNVDSPRLMSGAFFTSHAWRTIRDQVIFRDGRFDLGVFGLYIDGPVYVHHINPLKEYDIINMTEKVTSMDNLISTSLKTHNAIHYKDTEEEYVERKPGDTIPW